MASLRKEENNIVVKSRVKAMPDLMVETLHISCASDPYVAGKDYTILYIYSMGAYDAQARKPYRKIRPGYVLMKRTDVLNAECPRMSTDEGYVHGQLCRWFFGLQPSDLRSDGAVFSGGAF